MKNALSTQDLFVEFNRFGPKDINENGENFWQWLIKKYSDVPEVANKTVDKLTAFVQIAIELETNQR